MRWSTHEFHGRLASVQLSSAVEQVGRKFPNRTRG